MPKKPREMERIILADGWIFKTQVGSHKQYVHPVKKRASNDSVSLQGFNQGSRKLYFKAGRAEVTVIKEGI